MIITLILTVSFVLLTALLLSFAPKRHALLSMWVVVSGLFWTAVAHAQEPYSALQTAASSAPTSAIAEVVPVFTAIVTAYIGWAIYKWIKRSVKGM